MNVRGFRGDSNTHNIYFSSLSSNSMANILSIMCLVCLVGAAAVSDCFVWKCCQKRVMFFMFIFRLYRRTPSIIFIWQLESSAGDVVTLTSLEVCQINIYIGNRTSWKVKISATKQIYELCRHYMFQSNQILRWNWYHW